MYAYFPQPCFLFMYSNYISCLLIKWNFKLRVTVINIDFAKVYEINPLQKKPFSLIDLRNSLHFSDFCG